jgi:hypothetical protein
MGDLGGLITCEKKFTSKGPGYCYYGATSQSRNMAEDMAVQCAVVAAALAAAVAATHDRRRDREPSAAVWSTRACPWDSVRGKVLYCGWYQPHLRCTFATFADIAGRVEAKWTSIHPPGSTRQGVLQPAVGPTERCQYHRPRHP